ncbi:fructose PTS transporter subunit IIA [Heyndrickxia faecalis]|uniref:PTS sugar transporter subunit IIA n=1 Tax=Heyndrickxia faecalis TaxID=2824910 RepID=UPI003D252450
MTGSEKGFLTKKNIVIDLDAHSKEDAIRKLSKVLEKNGNVTDSDMFVKDVLERERLTTTGIGKNIAIPHGKSSAVKDTTLIFAKNKQFLDWNSLDGSKVNMIFLMAVNTNDAGKEHLKMLTKLAGRLMDDNFVAAIKQENDAEKLLHILKDEGEETK